MIGTRRDARDDSATDLVHTVNSCHDLAATLITLAYMLVLQFAYKLESGRRHRPFTPPGCKIQKGKPPVIFVT